MRWRRRGERETTGARWRRREREGDDGSEVARRRGRGGSERRTMVGVYQKCRRDDDWIWCNIFVHEWVIKIYILKCKILNSVLYCGNPYSIGRRESMANSVGWSSGFLVPYNKINV